MTIDKGSMLYKKAKSNTIKYQNKTINGKPIVEVLDKNGYYIGSCIPGYVHLFLQSKGIEDMIEEEYKILLKERNKNLKNTIK